MRPDNLTGASRRKGLRNTRYDAQARPVPGLAEREFHADAQNRRWVADITPTPLRGLILGASLGGVRVLGHRP